MEHIVHMYALMIAYLLTLSATFVHDFGQVHMHMQIHTHTHTHIRNTNVRTHLRPHIYECMLINIIILGVMHQV